MKYNKLVRDKIPKLIEQEGNLAHIKILSKEEYIQALENKLDEEVQEYKESKELEEMADILEVLYAICKVHGYTKEQLFACNEHKFDRRGGFEQRIFLLSKEKK